MQRVLNMVFRHTTSDGKTRFAAAAPFLLSAFYGAMVIWITAIATKFILRIGPLDSLLFIGIALSTFAAVTLWPALIEYGKGTPVSELRRRLRESEESIKALSATRDELQDNLTSYENELAVAYQRFRLVLQTFNIATFYCDTEHRIEWAHNYTGATADIIGKTDADLMPPDVAAILLDLKPRAMQSGETLEGQIVINVEGSDRHYAVQVAPRYDTEGEIVGTISVSSDVSEKMKWHKHLALMIHEVNHRARNMLSVIVSILSQTAGSATTVPAFQTKLLGRVTALAKSIDLITEDSWTASALRKLVDAQLNHALKGDCSKVQMIGEDILLRSKAIQNLGLAIHELATNAQNYGALSDDGGEIVLSWTMKEENGADVLVLRWQEFTDRTISEPEGHGFGLKALGRVLANELDGSASVTWNKRGLLFEMKIPSQWLDVPSSTTVYKNAHNDDGSLIAYESMTGEKISYPAA